MTYLPLFPLALPLLIGSGMSVSPPSPKLWVSSRTHSQIAEASRHFELGNGSVIAIAQEFPNNADEVIGVSPLRNESLVYIEGELRNLPVTPLMVRGDKGVFLAERKQIPKLRQLGLFVEEIALDDLSSQLPDEIADSGLRPSRSRKEQLETPQIDPAAIDAFLRTLTGLTPFELNGVSKTIPDRSTQTGRETTLQYLETVLNSYGFETRRKCYKPGRSSGCNLEATLWGEDRAQAILFGAHFDSATSGAADDNGSGTAGLLEIARLFSGQTVHKTLRLAFFDQEEAGLVGSKAYADQLSSVPDDAKPVAMFNMDMIGYDSDNDGAIHIIDCKRKESMPLTQLVIDSIAATKSNLKKSDTCTNRSDHASFWNKGIPAIIVAENFFGKDGNSCYHRTCDTMEKINVPYMNSIIQTMVDVAVKSLQAN